MLVLEKIGLHIAQLYGFKCLNQLRIEKVPEGHSDLPVGVYWVFRCRF
jgi:hypothetical protein